jgi:hypothetical protein
MKKHLLFLGLCLLPLTRPAVSDERVSGPNILTAYIPEEKLSIMAGQEELVWCWAASAQAIFKYYGYDIEQKAIVKEVLGAEFVTVASPPIMISMFSRSYTATDGRRFRVKIKRYADVFGWWGPALQISSFGAVKQLDNASLIQNLKDNKPIFYCTRTHAMVAISMSYIPVWGQPVITGGWALDPFPTIGDDGHVKAIGRRQLTEDEMRSTFAVEVEVTAEKGKARRADKEDEVAEPAPVPSKSKAISKNGPSIRSLVDAARTNFDSIRGELLSPLGSGRSVYDSDIQLKGWGKLTIAKYEWRKNPTLEGVLDPRGEEGWESKEDALRVYNRAILDWRAALGEEWKSEENELDPKLGILRRYVTFQKDKDSPFIVVKINEGRGEEKPFAVFVTVWPYNELLK